MLVISPVDVAIGLFDHCRASGSLHSVMGEQIFPSPDAFSRLRLKEYNVMGNFNPMFSGDRHSLLNCTLRSALVSSPLYLRLLSGEAECSLCGNAKGLFYH